MVVVVAVARSMPSTFDPGHHTRHQPPALPALLQQQTARGHEQGTWGLLESALRSPCTFQHNLL